MRYTTALLLTLVAIHATAAPLTVERIFGAPDLTGPRLREPKFSPDGRYVTYLQAKQDNKDQLDLWAFDTRTGKAQLLVDSRALLSGEEKLSAEEEARRERQRTASLRGIVEYQFTADGHRLLIPLGGDLYLYELNARENPVTRLTNKAGATDARFSPGGRYVSFIRDQNLYVIDLSTKQERALTPTAPGWCRTASRSSSRRRRWIAIPVIGGRRTIPMLRLHASTMRRCRKSNASRSTPTALACIGSATRRRALRTRTSS
jgi:dipeptidyl-peptidase-4